MDEEDKNFDNFQNPLILRNPINTNFDKNIEILKIKDFIKLKYLKNSKFNHSINKNLLDRDLTTIKHDVQIIDADIKTKMLLISKTIENQEAEIKKLYIEKKLLEQNKIKSNIIKNQQKLIFNQKKDNIDLKLNVNEIEKKLNEKDISNRKFLINNAELKNTISRYVKHSNKLQANISQLQEEYSEARMTKSQIDEMNKKINFYQEENIRLSSKITVIQNDFASLKNTFIEVENEKNNIYREINELNKSLIKSNIVVTPFDKENHVDNSLNLKTLEKVTDSNLSEKKIKDKHKNDKDDQINNIFN
jgi:chromosome segregation ATPase